MRTRLIAEHDAEKETSDEKPVGDVSVADPHIPVVVPTAVGGVGSHDIGGVIDGAIVTENDLVPEPPMMAGEIPKDKIEIPTIQAELVTPPVSGEWKPKGENHWVEKEKHWVAFKHDVASNSVPRIGGATAQLVPT